MTLLEAYFVYLNGTALNSDDVGKILNSQEVYEEYGVLLQQYGLTSIVRKRERFVPLFIVYKVHQCLASSGDRLGLVYSFLFIAFAVGQHREATRKQHGVVHHGGTRGRAGDRPDCHHDIDGVHQEKVRCYTVKRADCKAATGGLLILNCSDV